MNAAESIAWRPEIVGHSEDILPFFTQVQDLIPQGGVYVEVGCFLGRSVAFMASIRPDLTIYAIDAWSDESVAPSDGAMSGLTAYDTFLENTKGLGIWAIRDNSVSGMKFMPDGHADFVFLDAGHDYPDIKADIAAARRIVKPGGILSGHDFAGQNGVEMAVREAFGMPYLSAWDGPVLPGAKPGCGRCWWVQR